MTCKVLPQSASCLPLHLYFLLPMCHIPHTLFILNHSWPKNFILFFKSIPLCVLFTYLEMLFAFIFFPPNLLCLLLLWKHPCQRYSEKQPLESNTPPVEEHPMVHPEFGGPKESPLLLYIFIIASLHYITIIIFTFLSPTIIFTSSSF